MIAGVIVRAAGALREIGVPIPGAGLRGWTVRKHLSKSNRLLAGLAGLAAVLSSASAADPCHYAWQPLPNIPGDHRCLGKAINNLGHVAGSIDGFGDLYRGFIWSPETGTRQLPTPAGVVDLQVLGINDHDHIVGALDRGQPGRGLEPFFWDGQQYTVIPLPAWSQWGEATGLNNSDQVAGVAYGNPSRAFLWQNGVYEDLGPLIGTPYSHGRAINDLGQVAGDGSSLPLIDDRAFVSNGSAVTWLTHPAGLAISRPWAASNNGFFAGDGTVSAFPDPSFHYVGIIWTPWAVHVVQPPPQFRDARIRSINDAGRAVGNYERPSISSFVWQNGVPADLGPLVAAPAPSGLESAQAINNRGQIVAWAAAGTVLLNPAWVAGDLTGDCHVALDDLLILLAHFGSPRGSFPLGDVNLDGDVDLADLTVLLSNWGQ